MHLYDANYFNKDFFLDSLSYSILFSYLIGGAYAAFLVMPNNPSRCGDFSVFYSAAVTVLEAPTKLYDVEHIINLQGLFWPEEKVMGFNSFAYPPFTGLALAFFSFFTPQVSKLIYVSFSLLFLFISSQLIQKKNLSSFTAIQVMSFILLFTPFAVGVNAGQNNSLSFLLLILIVLNFERGYFHNVGALIGIWNFKPQFGVPCLILALLLKSTGKTKILIGYSLVTFLEIIISLQYFGDDIFKKWLSVLSLSSTHNAIMLEKINLLASIFSLVPWVKAFELNLYLFYSSIIITLLSLILLIYIFYKSRNNPWIIGPMIVLLSPQTGYYDSALIIPFIIQKLSGNKSELVWQMLFGGILITLVTSVQRDYYLQIYPLFILYLTWWAFKKCKILYT